MKRLILFFVLAFAALFAAFSAMGGGSVPAQADVRYDHTCNSSGNFTGVYNNLGLGYNGNGSDHLHAHFTVAFSFQCGHGGTVEWELQVCANQQGQPCFWVDDLHQAAPNDAIDHQQTNGGAAGDTVFYSANVASYLPCGWNNQTLYRLRVYDSTPGTGNWVHTLQHNFAGC